MFAALIPVVPDETYYWEWSRRLAAGYFDHPPAIALFIRGGVALFGVTPLGVRFLPVFGGWIASLLLVMLAGRLGGGRAALRAAIIIACVPLAAAGLVVATPSAPLMLFSAVLLVALDRAASATPLARARVWWLVAGAALGLAMLSDYEGVLLGLGALVALVAIRPLRAHLRTPWPWLGALVALLTFAPNIRWNAAHAWISYRFQLEHGLGAHHGAPLSQLASFVGGQLAVASPVLFVLGAIAVARVLRRGAVRERLLAVLVVVPVAVVTVGALRGPVEVNWTSPAYLAAIVLLAARDGARAWRRWLAAGCALGGVLVALTYAQSVAPFLPVSAARDPTARGSGWRAVASAADSLSRAARAAAGDGRVWLAADRYQEASELAFHIPDHPVTYSFNLSGRTNQYRFWPLLQDVARPGDAVVLVLEDGRPGTVHPAIARLRPHFTRMRLAETVALRRGADVRGWSQLWVLEGWHGTWPPDTLANRAARRDVAPHGRRSLLASRIR